MTRATFRTHPTPVGDVMLVCVDDRLVTLDVLDDDDRHGTEDMLARMTRLLHAVPQPDPGCAPDAADQLDEYFAGERRVFDVPLDWRFVNGFAREALQRVCDVPYGQTAGYGEVAAMAGHPRAGRAVGNACARSPFSIIVPVHRVVHTDGSIGGYGSRLDMKRYLLRHEHATGVRGM